ncbi:reverse transcriptase [Tanacetum coccineum]
MPRILIPLRPILGVLHHVSQLKSYYCDSVSMGSFPLCDSEDLLAATPLKLLDKRMVKQNNKMVVFGLIQWSNGSEEDATWEKLEDLLARFLEFTLDPSGQGCFQEGWNVTS